VWTTAVIRYWRVLKRSSDTSSNLTQRAPWYGRSSLKGKQRGKENNISCLFKTQPNKPNKLYERNKLNFTHRPQRKKQHTENTLVRSFLPTGQAERKRKKYILSFKTQPNKPNKLYKLNKLNFTQSSQRTQRKKIMLFKNFPLTRNKFTTEKNNISFIKNSSP